MKKAFYKNQKGFTLPLGLMFLAILTILGVTGVVITTTDLEIGRNYKTSVQAFYAAEGGLSYAVSEMREAFHSLTPNLNITPPTIDGVTFDEFSLASVGSSSTVSLDGTFSGLSATVQKYEITVKARISGSETYSQLTQTVQDQLIPVFQFGIFYQEDAEILPGPSMTFTGGRIHSNSDIYLNTGSSSTFSIDAEVTSAGDIFHRRKEKSSTPGTVKIKDANGNYQTLTIDSDSATWTEESQTRWGGTVKTKEHEIYEVTVPTPTETPRDIIGTGSGSLYSKSGLRIMDGVAQDKDGNVVDLTDGGTVADPISTTTFYDHREKKTITVKEVDMNKLQLSTNAMNALSNPPSGGDNGILYVSSTDNSESVRLYNGSVLPAAGLTVASNNPVYVQGNYNNTTSSPAAIICDAVTILSNNWNDADSGTSDLNDRVATNTTVKAAIISGNKNTVGSQYSGGVENFPRFLEKWSGKTFTYHGSLVCLWESQQATGDWKYGGKVYKAPTRNWSYGIDANNLPPGTPRVRNIDKTGWYQVMD